MSPSNRFHSYRGLLTWRFALLWAATFIVFGVAIHFAVRVILLRQVDRSLSLVASLQASAVAQSPPGRMELRDWDLREGEALRLQEVIWQIQVWDEFDQVVVRSENLATPLPPPPEGLDVVRSGQVLFQSEGRSPFLLRQVFYPLQRLDPRHLGHIIQVAVSLQPLQRTLRRIDMVLGAVGLLGLLVTSVLSWWTSTGAIRPVSAILDQVRSIQSPGEGKRITEFARTREFHDLVTVLNEMLSRLERAYEAERRFTADASHELRSPLTAMRGTLQVALRRERDPADYREAIRSVLEEVERIQEMVGDLLVLARQDAGVLHLQPEPVNLKDLVDEVVEMFQANAQVKRVSFDTESVETITFSADCELLRRVLINIVDNAVEYAPEESVVRLTATSPGDSVHLVVEDRGTGIPESVRSHVFERFYRGDPVRTAGEGAGLGLSLVRAIVAAHAGTVWIEDADPGTRVVVELPATDAT
jgi:two-component system OmpR family sensor kinase